MPLKKPIKIGKYEVVGLLGKGGMGVVYKANDPLLGRSVAIKMMTTLEYVDNPDLLQRFYREAQSTGSLHHRNIVTVYELGDHEGSPYLVMEYLEGETLDAVIQSNRPLPLLDRINFILEVCDGLTYAHQRSVVHRDIKPGNIMVLKDSGVKIVDFGIAHIGNRTVTRTGQLLGSLPYMSPEQISGKQVDARTDIFSLGVVFYQLLTSHLPFEGETPAASLLKIIHERPRALAEYGTFPPELEDILLRALAKDRDERYLTAQDFAFDLVQIRGRIRQEIVEEHLNQAELLLAREELFQAREKLAEILKIDRHNTRAVELSRATQQRIQQQEVGEQVRELRTQAEDAYQKEQFAVALDLIQKAISLHATDPDLHRLRSSVQEAKTKTERLQRAMTRAESAYGQGELDAAKQAIEEALALAPDDVHAKSLHRMIQRDWAQRVQRLEALGLIEEARKEIASRNFTLAMEVLRKAEVIDPANPQLRALIEAAQAAREQERRRKALETVKREIEADLDRDDFQAAFTRAEAAVQEFPDDRGLQKLKDLAEKQRVFAERKYFIEEQVSRARKLLDAGRADEVLQVLQSAREKIGGDPQLDSLSAVARETLERQRFETRKLDYLRRAKDQLRLQQYAEAVRTLENAQSELGNNPEIDDLLQFTVEQQLAEKRRQDADAAVDQAQRFITDGNYAEAIAVLEAALREAPDEELRLILVQARHAAADHSRLLEEALANSESMIQGQRPSEALKYLESQPPSFSRDKRFDALVRKAREQAERAEKIGQTIEKIRALSARNQFDAARSALEESGRTYGRSAELSKLLAEIEQREAQAAAENIEKTLIESRALMSEGRPDQAIDRLSSIHTIAGKVPQKLSDAYQSLQQEAANAQARKFKTEIEQLLAQGSYPEAVSLLRRAQTEFPQNRELKQLSKVLEQAMQRRSDGEMLLESARESFQKKAWREGGDFCLRTEPLAARDPVLRNRALSALESAAVAAVGKEWRHAEYLLQCMSQLHPAMAVPAAVKDGVAAAKLEESIRKSLDAASRWQAEGDIEQALAAVAAGLAKHPGESRLVELQATVQRERGEREKAAGRERERKEKETYVAEIQRRVKTEPSADGRIRILEEALRKYPDAKTFQESISQARELERRVSSLRLEAQKLEAARNYDQALGRWSAIAELGVLHPDAPEAMARLRRLREDARTAARAAWVRAIQDALRAFDLNSASSLLADAQREFPNDTQLAEVASSRDQILKQRQESLGLLAKAQSECKGQRWQPAVELIGRALQSSGGDPSVSNAALAAALHGSQSALPANLPAAEMLLEQAARIQANSPEVAGLRATIERQAREEIVRARLADVQAVVKAGDTERALSELDSARSNFPDDPRFLALKKDLERNLETERKAQQQQRRLQEVLETAQSLRKEGDLSRALQKVSQGLREFPNHAPFAALKRSIEGDIGELKEQKQREQKQREKEQVQQKKSQQQEKEHRKLVEKKRIAVESAARSTAAAERWVVLPTGKSLNLYLAIGAATVAIIGGVIWKATHRTPPPPTPSTVAIQINTTPSGAIVRSKDSGESCVTPHCTLNLAIGTHEVQAELSGYQPLTTTISADSNSASPVLLDLVPLPKLKEETSAPRSTPEAARLDLRDAQPGALVLLDKKQIGRTNRQGAFSATVALGSHQIEVVSRNRDTAAIQRDFASGVRVELRGDDFVSPKQPAPHENVNSEQKDWQAIKDSQEVQAVNGFLKNHPSGAFTTQAQSKLESLYWAKATSSGTTDGYSQYLEQFPTGKFAQQAHSGIADLDWKALENSTDASALQSFMRKYPSGSDHDKALARLDDLTWQRTDQNDVSSLRSYVGNFPEGRHAADARKKTEDLSRSASAARPNEPRAVPTPMVDDNQSVREILTRYQKAYEAQDVQELHNIWPGMTAVQIKSVGDFFRQASNLSLQYQVSQVEINGDNAVVKFAQTLKYAVDGKSGKTSAKIVMQLNRLQGGTWRINSIR